MKPHNILVAFLWLATALSLQAGTAVQIKAGGLNVRSGPSTNNGKIGVVYSGQKYAHEGNSGSWFKIRYDNRIGYVYGGSLSAIATAQLATVTASALNVRTGPGSEYTRVGSIYKNQRFTMTGSTSGSWVQIFHGGNRRWVHGNYVAKEGTTPPPPPPPVSSPINITWFGLGANNNASTTTRFITTRHWYQSSGTTVRDYRMSENSNFAGASWNSYVTRPNITLSSGNGTKRVYVQFRDTSFRLSNVRSDTIWLDESVAPPPPSNNQMLWPITGRTTSAAGWRIHPISKVRKMHNGRDFGAPHGTKIVASAAGEIVADFYSGACGGIIEIKHDNGYSTRYVHVDNSPLRVGDRVTAGQEITVVMQTRAEHKTCSTGDHLHFEIVNPNGTKNIVWDDNISSTASVTAATVIPYRF